MMAWPRLCHQLACLQRRMLQLLRC
jgi:hypothetical protein